MADNRITSAKQARAAIGKRVFWNDRDSARYYGAIRSGILQDVAGKNVLIDNDWKWRPHLNNFRLTEEK